MTNKRDAAPPSFDFDEVKGRLQVIVDRLENPAGCEIPSALQAKEILVLWRNPSFVKNRSFAKKAEEKKLRELLKQTKKLRQVWREIDPELQIVMRSQLNRNRFESDRGFSTGSERSIFSFVEFGPDLVERALPATISALEKGEQAPNRTKWEVIRIVHACAIIWKDRMDQTPKAASQTAWASFVQEVFDCIGIDASVENSIRSWAESD